MALPPGLHNNLAIASAVLLAFLVAAGAFILTSRMRNYRAVAHDWRRRLLVEVSMLHRKREILSEYTPEYYHAFQEGGWSELKEILDGLTYVCETVDQYITQNRFKEATLLCRYFLSEVEDGELQRSRKMFAHLSRLENWQDTTRQILIHLSKTIGAAASETKKLGVDRSRRRKPTLLTVSEILSQSPK